LTIHALLFCHFLDLGKNILLHFIQILQCPFQQKRNKIAINYLKKGLQSKLFVTMRIKNRCHSLDSTVNELDTDYQNTVIQLRNNSDEYVNFLRQINDEKIFLIILGYAGQYLRSIIHQIPINLTPFALINNVSVFKSEEKNPFFYEFRLSYR